MTPLMLAFEVKTVGSDPLSAEIKADNDTFTSASSSCSRNPSIKDDMSWAIQLVLLNANDRESKGVFRIGHSRVVVQFRRCRIEPHIGTELKFSCDSNLRNHARCSRCDTRFWRAGIYTKLRFDFVALKIHRPHSNVTYRTP